MEGTVWRYVVGGVKVLVAIVSVPAWFLAAFFVGWFWTGLPSFATCNVGFQPSCVRGHGMPQYLTVTVLTISASALLLAALFGWHRRRTWFIACLCALAAGLGFTVLPGLLDPVTPDWWFAS